jgi:uncharacterized protein (TIGR03435 family)
MTLKAGLCTLCFTIFCFAQQPPAPAFEVATIKPSAPLNPAALRAGTAHVGTKIDAARIAISSESLLRLICLAYRIRPYQVSGPAWLKTTTYDVEAKIPEGRGPEQVPAMLQALLAERFGLSAHVDGKEQPVYALVVARGGPKMKESDAGPEDSVQSAPEQKRAASLSIPTIQGDVKVTGGPDGMVLEMPNGEIAGKLRMAFNTGGIPPTLHFTAMNITMRTFAEMLSIGVVERPVVDMTGVRGHYDLEVDLSAVDALSIFRSSVNLPVGGGSRGDGPNAASDPSGASILSSIQKLGLRLEPRKLPLDTLIIDHMNRTPTEN